MMKSKTGRIGVVSLTLLAVLLLVTPAAAQATRIAFTAWDIPGAMSGGRTWMEDGHFYMRGLQGTSQVFQVSPVQDLGISGEYAVVFNANIELATGCGHTWGKASNADWKLSFSGQICFAPLGNPVSFTTRGVGQGKGEMKGLQLRYGNVNGFMTGFILETPSH